MSPVRMSNISDKLVEVVEAASDVVDAVIVVVLERVADVLISQNQPQIM